MFQSIPPKILNRMRYLEALDAKDRKDGTAHLKRLRQIPPETGKFIALLAAGTPAGDCLEIGASAGYSGLWLALAALEIGRKVITIELLPDKCELAKETFNLADVENVIELVAGDARDYLPDYKNISFCFLDAEKDVYQECYEMIVPNMAKGGILAADNVLSHQDALQPMVDNAMADNRIDSLVVPIGKGILVCRKI
ncbi:MAG: O-methyltransferase [candidate division Zixibacteria bacterium]|nr:O-methyltransferase [candidate division Zixibacteria bacterium]